MGLFDGKVAIVTGAGRGIGRAEALLLASEGANVVVNDFGGGADGTGGDKGPAQQVVDEIEAAGGVAVADSGSVASFADAEALVQRAVETFGGLDVVINNAGILRDRMTVNMTEEEWDSVVNVHMKGHFAVARHAAAYWRQKSKATDGAPTGATMVNTASESGLYGNAGQLNYAAAKAGIASMTIVLARELERLGVRVNCLAPVARTRLTEAVAGDAMKPGKDGFDRFAPENVAAVAAWLASDLSAPLSGQVVKVMGGVVQLLQGWRPLTEATSDEEWTIDSVAATRDALLAKSDGAIPPFFFPQPVKLGWGSAEEAFRAELVEFLEAHAPPEARRRRDFSERETSTLDDGVPPWAREWQATLFDHGWMVPGYPPELGGRNATPAQTMVFLEELSRRGITRSLHFGGYAIVGPSLLQFGDERQQAMAPAAIRGDTVWCIGMSEPGAGSDLAALSTRAERHGDTYVVTGQKVWTSYAQIADRCLCYVRTDPTAPKHKGISALLIDMRTPGIDIRPLRHITGATEFAEVFFTDVEVPVADRLGAENDGWRITSGSLAHERGGLWVEGVARAQAAVDGLIDLARRRGVDADPGVRRTLARAYQRVASLRALGYRGFAAFTRGDASADHSYLKLAASELNKELAELGMELQGAWGALADPLRGEEHGRWPHAWFISFAGTVAGGSSEIQRNIIATRVLGLPALMDFTLSADQQLLVDSLDTVLAGACPPAVVRAVAEGDRDAARGVGRHLADFAALGDGPVCEHALAAERLGRARAPGPWLAASALALPLLRAVGHELADAVAAGERAATVAWAGDDGQWSVPPSADPVRTFVLELDLVDDVVVVLPDGIAVVPADPSSARRLEWLDLTRTAWEASLPSDSAPKARALARDAGADCLARATVVLAAEACGVARRMLDLSVEYAKERVQFDQPIGAFQAVQHRLADLALDVERSWAGVTWAAMCLDEPEAAGPDAAPAPHIAKAIASEVAVHAARSSIQVHGGIGYTWEHDLHLWLRRATTDAHLLGTAHEHQDVLAGLVM